MTKPPVSAESIDPAWLTAALQPRHPGAEVTSVEVTDRTETTNLHLRLSVAYRSPVGAPSTMFAKLLPEGPRRATIAATGMGPTEVRFYRDLAASVPMRVPVAHVALDDADGSFVLLLEDLRATGCEVSAGPRGVTADEAADALVGFAHLHAAFEDPSRRAELAPWATPLSIGSDYGANLLQHAMEHRRDRMTDRFAAISRVYISKRSALHALWTEPPHTLIHGDAHIGNVFFDDGRVGFLDWGIANVNTPMRDVSYFLNMAMDIGERRERQHELLRHYLSARGALGATEISFDAARRAHRLHAAYCVVASCQVATFPDDATPARRVHSDAFMARAEAAIEDLDAIGALRTEGVEIPAG